MHLYVQLNNNIILLYQRLSKKNKIKQQQQQQQQQQQTNKTKQKQNENKQTNKHTNKQKIKNKSHEAYFIMLTTAHQLNFPLLFSTFQLRNNKWLLRMQCDSDIKIFKATWMKN